MSSLEGLNDDKGSRLYTHLFSARDLYLQLLTEQK